LIITGITVQRIAGGQQDWSNATTKGYLVLIHRVLWVYEKKERHGCGQSLTIINITVKQGFPPKTKLLQLAISLYRRTIYPIKYKRYDIRHPTNTNHTHEPRSPDAGGNEVPMNTTLSTIAKENVTKAQVKRSMHNMKMLHVRKSARYIERVTGVDVTAFLKEKGVEL